MRLRAAVAAVAMTVGCRGAAPAPSPLDASQPKHVEEASKVPFLARRLADVRARRVLVLDRRVTRALGTTPCLATDRSGATTATCDGRAIAELPALPDREPLHELVDRIVARGPTLGAAPSSTTDEWLVASGAQAGLRLRARPARGGAARVLARRVVGPSGAAGRRRGGPPARRQSPRGSTAARRGRVPSQRPRRALHAPPQLGDAVEPHASKIAELLAIGDAHDAEVHARLADEREPAP